MLYGFLVIKLNDKMVFINMYKMIFVLIIVLVRIGV